MTNTHNYDGKLGDMIALVKDEIDRYKGGQALEIDIPNKTVTMKLHFAVYKKNKLPYYTVFDANLVVNCPVPLTVEGYLFESSETNWLTDDPSA